MDLRSSTVIGMAWNLRSACRNRWSASSECATYLQRTTTLPDDVRLRGSHSVTIDEPGKIRIRFYPAAVDLCHEECEQLNDAIPLEADPLASLRVHSTTQCNGFIERFHRTLLEEHLRIKGRTTWHETVAEMQKDLDAYLETYNRQRPHRGRGMRGRTPYDVFKAGIPKKSPARRKPARKEVKTAAQI